MSDWKAELDALRAQTEAYARKVGGEAVTSRPLPPPAALGSPLEVVAPIKVEPINWGAPEREEISRRVQNFRDHQRRIAREREEFASSTIAKLRRPEPK